MDQMHTHTLLLFCWKCFFLFVWCLCVCLYCLLAVKDTFTLLTNRHRLPSLLHPLILLHTRRGMCVCVCEKELESTWNVHTPKKTRLNWFRDPKFVLADQTSTRVCVCVWLVPLIIEFDQSRNGRRRNKKMWKWIKKWATYFRCTQIGCICVGGLNVCVFALSCFWVVHLDRAWLFTLIFAIRKCSNIF